ncbi:hypothetical protein [Glutamicibacter sp.]|uniref:hypothetical protein n=1 Tax=Glutamicibacter sp. TaxID=1931995 RepID=UPI0028BF3F2F|nr:hypothetical protein [Glutamicibacter sp.]
MSSNKETNAPTPEPTLPPGAFGCNLDDHGDHEGDLLTLLISRLDSLLRPAPSGKLK